MNAKNLLPIIFLATLSLSAMAQENQETKVLTGQAITQSALIDALSPDSGIHSRSIHIVRENQPAVAAAPKKPASASLLITFETNSANLTPRAKHSLDVVGQALSSNKLSDFRFSIEGHADPRGDSNANFRLSQERAESVRQYLVQNDHIELARLEAVGKGDTELVNKSNPIAPENRRVTIVNLSQ